MYYTHTHTHTHTGFNSDVCNDIFTSLKIKHTEKIKEAGSRRESLFHDYGKRISHRGIKSGTTYYTHQQCSYQISINEIQDNSQDHVVQLLNLLNAEKMGSERVVLKPEFVS